MSDSKTRLSELKFHSERIPMSSCEAAGGYVLKMLEKEGRGWGDTSNALTRLSRRYGISYWTLYNLRIGRAKTVEASVFNRIRSAYRDMCERQIANLKHELEVERAMNPDAFDEDFAREAEKLLAKARQAKKTKAA